MQLLLPICALVALAHAGPQAHVVSKDKLREAAMVIVNDCKEQTGASDADVQAVRAHKMPTTQPGRCLIECLFNTAKFLSGLNYFYTPILWNSVCEHVLHSHVMKDGKFNKAGAITFATPAMKGDEKKVEKMKQMMDVCEKEIDASGSTDSCKIAQKFAECTVIHGKEYGFEFPNNLA